MILTSSSAVAGDASACMIISTANTIATEHLHLMMRVLTGGSTSATVAQNLLTSATLHVASTIGIKTDVTNYANNIYNDLYHYIHTRNEDIKNHQHHTHHNS